MARIGASRNWKWFWGVAASALLAATPVFAAEEPVLVKDIIPGSTSSGPTGLTDFGGTLFFAALDPTNGTELWKSDGTAAGTVMVKDIHAGTGSSNPQLFTDVNGTLFFRADDGAHGAELWKSDGTAAGTVMVKDIQAGTHESSLRELTNVNGTLFFRAFRSDTGFELWKSDGTAAGTALVKDIQAGIGSSYPLYLTDVNGTLFFRATDGSGTGAHGDELWKSDGTAAGTVMVKDIYAVWSYGSSPKELTDVNGTLFFRARDGTTGAGAHGDELWKSDGTAAGTVMVKDIASGNLGSNPAFLTDVNGTLFFRARDGFTAGAHGDELWKSDGTAAGTVQVKDIQAGTGSSHPSVLTDVNGTLFFKAIDGSTGGAHGDELWKSDGTAGGTVLVKDIRAGTGSSRPTELTDVNGTLFFVANDGTHGDELWTSDGTAAGTMLVKDIWPGGTSSFLARLTDVNGTLFFRATDGFTTGAHGFELWACLSNRPPVAICQDVTVPADENCRGHVTGNDVDAGSYDPDGDDLTLTLSPAGPYGLGDTTVTLTVDDGNGETDSCTATVSVVDMTAPTPTCTVSTSSLWSPNNQMEDVGLAASATDACDASPALTVSIYSDEGNGTGQHSPDAAIDTDSDLELRKQRDGNGDGRVYLIVITAEDEAGNTATTCCTVVVPHGSSAAAAADVANQAADAAAYCNANGGAAPRGFEALLAGVVLE